MLFAWAMSVFMAALAPLFNLLPSGHLDLPDPMGLGRLFATWNYYVPVWSILDALRIWFLGVSAYIGLRLFTWVYSMIPGKGT